MAIDASIYSQLKQPEPVNMLAELVQAGQVQGLQTQNQLAQLTMREHERAQREAEEVRGAVRGFGADQAANYNKLLGLGNLSAAQGYQKANLEQAKTGAETARITAEATDKTFGTFQQAIGSVQTPQQAAQVIAAGYNDPQIGAVLQKIGRGKTLEQALTEIPTDPMAFREWQSKAAIGAEKLAQFAKVQTLDLGGTRQTQLVNPATGQVTTLDAAPITQSPDSVATNATSRANNAATVGASMAHAGAVNNQAQATRDAAAIQTGFRNQQDLRKEYEGLPEIKSYKAAFPAFAAVKDAAGRNTPQSDINLVYAIAKLYDPNSVVREGEYATVANSPNIPERVKGYAQYLAGGGRLSPETKQQILAEAEGRIGTYQAEADKARSSYEGIARHNGIAPEAIFSAMGDVKAAPPPAAPGVAPPKAGPRRVANEADYASLPSGAEFIDPHGKRRRKP